MDFGEHIFNVRLDKYRLKKLSKSALNRKWLVHTFAYVFVRSKIKLILKHVDIIKVCHNKCLNE
jgi:hypothetical protein